MLFALHTTKIYSLHTFLKQLSTCEAAGHRHILLGPEYEHDYKSSRIDILNNIHCTTNYICNARLYMYIRYLPILT